MSFFYKNRLQIIGSFVPEPYNFSTCNCEFFSLLIHNYFALVKILILMYGQAAAANSRSKSTLYFIGFKKLLKNMYVEQDQRPAFAHERG